MDEPPNHVKNLLLGEGILTCKNGRTTTFQNTCFINRLDRQVNLYFGSFSPSFCRAEIVLASGCYLTIGKVLTTKIKVPY